MTRLALLGILIAAGLAVGVYRAKLGAQETAAAIESLEDRIRSVNEEISVLRAEEAYLSRPERIGPLARDRLGLAPPSPEQFSGVEGIVGRAAVTEPSGGTVAGPSLQP